MANKNPNTSGLKSFADMPRSQSAAIQSMGGHAAKIANDRRKTFRETMELCLQELVDRNDKNGKFLEKITAQQAICLKQIAKAIQGDTSAAKYCSETVTPKQIELTGKDGQPLESKVKYITPESMEDIKKHIKDVIND